MVDCVSVNISIPNKMYSTLYSVASLPYSKKQISKAVSGGCSNMQSQMAKDNK